MHQKMLTLCKKNSIKYWMVRHGLHAPLLNNKVKGRNFFLTTPWPFEVCFFFYSTDPLQCSVDRAVSSEHVVIKGSFISSQQSVSFFLSLSPQRGPGTVNLLMSGEVCSVIILTHPELQRCFHRAKREILKPGFQTQIRTISGLIDLGEGK